MTLQEERRRLSIVCWNVKPPPRWSTQLQSSLSYFVQLSCGLFVGTLPPPCLSISRSPHNSSDRYKYFRKTKSNHGFRETRERQYESRNDGPTFTPHMPVPACLHLLTSTDSTKSTKSVSSRTSASPKSFSSKRTRECGRWGFNVPSIQDIEQLFPGNDTEVDCRLSLR